MRFLYFFLLLLLYISIIFVFDTVTLVRMIYAWCFLLLRDRYFHQSIPNSLNNTTSSILLLLLLFLFRLGGLGQGFF